MANKKKKGKAKAASSNPATALRRAERMYAKCAGQLAKSHEIDRRIREQAKVHHDAINAKIAELEPKLRAMLPDTDPAMARQYGKLLRQRREAHNTILNHRVSPLEKGQKPIL